MPSVTEVVGLHSFCNNTKIYRQDTILWSEKLLPFSYNCNNFVYTAEPAVINFGRRIGLGTLGQGLHEICNKRISVRKL